MISILNFTTKLALFMLVINFFLKGLLNSILSTVESLGVMFHMFLVTLNYPVELLNFFGFLFPLITFDALPVEGLYEKMFRFSNITDDHALTDQFQISGYSSIFIVSNIGSLFLISILEIVLCIFLWATRRYKLFRYFEGVQFKLE